MIGVAKDQLLEPDDNDTTRNLQYPIIVQLIQDADLRTVFYAHNGKPLSICGYCGKIGGCDTCRANPDEADFVVCYLCWVVIPAEDSIHHLEQEHQGFCRLCRTYVEGDMLEHTQQTHTLRNCNCCQHKHTLDNLRRRIKYMHLCCILCDEMVNPCELDDHLRSGHLWDRKQNLCDRTYVMTPISPSLALS